MKNIAEIVLCLFYDTIDKFAYMSEEQSFGNRTQVPK